MIRGGSWNNNAQNCRAANRNNNNPDNRNNNIGFRLVLSPAQQISGCRLLTHGQNPAPCKKGQKVDTRPGLVTGMERFGEHHGRVFALKCRAKLEEGFTTCSPLRRRAYQRTILQVLSFPHATTYCGRYLFRLLIQKSTIPIL